jgi:hypothetical protein
MRRILIERALYKCRAVHGGGRRRQELHSGLAAAPEPDDDLLAFDVALAKVAYRDPVKARLVEMRYFAGLMGIKRPKSWIFQPAPRTATGSMLGPGYAAKSRAKEISKINDVNRGATRALLSH